MRGPRARAAVAVTVTAVAAWLAAVVVLERQPRGIIVAHPGKTATPDAESKVLWAGKNATDGTCTASGTRATHPLKKGAFEIRTGPYERYREGLAWLHIECDGRRAAHVARKIERPVVQDRAEIARIGLDTKKMNTWLEREILPLVTQGVGELEGTSFDNTFSALSTHHVTIRVHNITATNTRIAVDEGLIIDSDLWVRISIDEHDCRVCLFDINRIELRGNIRARGRVTMAGEGIKVTTDLQPSLTRYETSVFLLPDNWEPVRRSVERNIQRGMPGLEKDVGRKLTTVVNEQVMALRDSAGPKFANWLTRNKVIPRVTQWVRRGDFRITRGKGEAGGEGIEFSISVAAPWLGRPAPRLNLDPRTRRSAVTLKVSYAMINKTIEVLLGESAAEALAGAKELREIIDGFEDGLTGKARLARSQSTRDLAKAFGEITRLLKLAGLEFDTSLGFALPVSVVPEKRDGIRISLAGARIIREARSAPRTWLAVSAEVKMGLKGRPSPESDREHLQRHIAIEAVPDEGSGETVPRHYRALAGLMTAVARGERTRWSMQHVEGEEGEAVAVRKSLDALGTMVQLKLPFDMPIGRLIIKIRDLENDHSEYAVTLAGRVQS